uniref:Ig-like domain-containing protein n=1 Tax=Haplochromis burtoni TaxID=8153 RepID=A0A3Q2W5G8_HAPBU
ERDLMWKMLIMFMTSNYTVVQWPPVLDPLHPGESVTLQCSIISVFDKATCSEDLSVFWFRAESNKSHPNIIYTHGNTHDECENRSEAQKRCVYRFSKNVSSSDAGTYYCAVDICGEILFGNGTALKLETLPRTASTLKLKAEILLFVSGLFICLIADKFGLSN